MKNKLTAIITAAAIVFTFAACGKKEVKEEKTSTATNVTVSEAVKDTIASTVSYTGEVKANASASVSPKASGTVEAVYVEIGDFVKAGTVLMRIDATSYQLSYNQAKASYNSATAAYNNVKNGSNAQTQVSLDQALANAQSNYDTALDNYNRQKALFDIGAISQVALDSAKTALDNAQIALDSAKTSSNLNQSVIAPQSEASAKASVEQAKAAMDIAAQSLANCTVKAPISGYISSKNVSVGQTASQGIEAFSIKNSNAVDVEINVTESVISYLNAGDNAKISIKSAKLDDINGTVSVVGETKNDATGMFTVKVSIPNESGKIKVGMLADVQLTTEKVADALVVPSDSILQSGEKQYVFVANGNKAEKKEVETGVTDGERIQILSGVEEGNNVIVEGKEYLSDKNADIKITTK